jgi:hypothetical protein
VLVGDPGKAAKKILRLLLTSLKWLLLAAVAVEVFCFLVVYEGDGVHLKATGNEMVAQELARVLPEIFPDKR